MRKRALLAIACANSLLTISPSVMAETIDAPVSLVRQIVDNAKVSPGARTCRLLLLANSSINESRKGSLEKLDHSLVSQNDLRTREFMTMFWHSQKELDDQRRKANLQNLPKDQLEQRIAFSKEATNEAFILARLINDDVTRSYADYGAFQLFRQLGDSDGVERANEALGMDVVACERARFADEEFIAAALSILDLQSNALVPALIPDLKPANVRAANRLHKGEFEKCEKLKLRGIALADRLDKGSQVRRKAHRDLVIWYSELGKQDKANQEKEALFGLVGIRDDSILYPKIGGCMSLVWWNDETKVEFLCGRG